MFGVSENWEATLSCEAQGARGGEVKTATCSAALPWTHSRGQSGVPHFVVQVVSVAL